MRAGWLFLIERFCVSSLNHQPVCAFGAATPSGEGDLPNYNVSQIAGNFFFMDDEVRKELASRFFEEAYRKQMKGELEACSRALQQVH
jgi:hypothetical protein